MAWGVVPRLEVKREIKKMRITAKDLAELGTGTIEREPKIVLRRNTVILETREPDGRIIKHYHHYKTREKAIALYEWWRSEYTVGNHD